MRIGIDIDGVLTNIEQFSLDYFSKYCVEKNINYRIGRPSYFLYDTFNVSEDIEDDFWNEFIFYYAQQSLARPFASEVIKKLKEEGNEIYILTARWLTNQNDEIGRKMQSLVKSWLDNNNIMYDRLIFSKANKEKKTDEVLKYKIDLMIEDSPYNINELAHITRIICYDTSYNKKCEGKNITRCYSWYDIYKTIKSSNDFKIME